MTEHRIRPANRLLASLQDDDWARVQSHLVTRPAPVRLVLQAEQAPISAVFFPNGGMASVTTCMSDGGLVEVATVGDEGFVGVGAVVGEQVSSSETMMQITGPSLEAMDVASFQVCLLECPTFRDAVHRYVQGFLALSLRSAGCLALHSVHMRCCRWLLMAHDRVRVDEFDLSQEFLAAMLGASRPTVSVVAGKLQEQGLIRYRHGRLAITDRAGLEANACECYGLVRARFTSLGLS